MGLGHDILGTHGTGTRYTGHTWDWDTIYWAHMGLGHDILGTHITGTRYTGHTYNWDTI